MEGTVKFDKVTCCALKRAFGENAEVANQLGGMVGIKEIKLFKDILHNTDEMKFVPSEIMKIVYSQIAKQELKRIDEQMEGDDDLSCSHSVEKHKGVLRAVIEKMSVVTI